jgi:pimeloyl-ACP methyl ester carboxylesterase
VLLVYGTADRLVPVDQGRTLASLISSSHLLEVPGATHWSTAFADAAIARAAAWVDAHSAVHA